MLYYWHILPRTSTKQFRCRPNRVEQHHLSFQNRGHKHHWVSVEYLRNSNQWWANWLIPVSAGFRTTNLNDKGLKKTTHQSASTGQLTIGLSGYNQLSKSVLLNVKIGVLVGNEN